MNSISKEIHLNNNNNKSLHYSMDSTAQKNKSLSRSRSKGNYGLSNKNKDINEENSIKAKVNAFKKSNYSLSCYSYNSFRGKFRETNQDRIAIRTYIPPPNNELNDTWPIIHYFAVFDGHSGENCSSFLKKNLLTYLIDDKDLLSNPKSALMNAFIKAEKEFVNKVKPTNIIDTFDRSGSCALVLLIINNQCYCSNLGDSLGYYSHSNYSSVSQINIEHNPERLTEAERIKMGGGSIYQRPDKPYRINPGKLSVTRAFGDVKCKIKELGGNPKVLIAIPEITSFQITNKSDFIILGSDGIFHELTIKKICKLINNETNIGQNMNNSKLSITKNICERIINESIEKGSTDNVSCIVITFSNQFSANNSSNVSFKNFKYELMHPIEDCEYHHSNENELNEDLYSIYKKNDNCTSTLSLTVSNTKSIAKMTSDENYHNRLLKSGFK